MIDPFAYHKPDAEQAQRIETLRSDFKDLLDSICRLTTPGTCSGRYVALAKTALEEACQWAVKSIAFEAENNPDRVDCR